MWLKRTLNLTPDESTRVANLLLKEGFLIAVSGTKQEFVNDPKFYYSMKQMVLNKNN